jgi:4-aminobutyrate aminotransferase-like enzyme
VCNSADVGAVLVEPVQTRGGINVAPPGFLPMLRRVCDEQRALLILDEIYTGFGRTGRWFACEHWKVTPDLTCVGKALTGGFPLSACIGRAEIMDRAWPTSEGEAIHTSTFLGHPVGCAMALAQIDEIGRGKLVERSALLGRRLLTQLQEIRPPQGITLNPRGLGLLVGLEARLEGGKPATDRILGWIKAMLGLGYILLPEGEASNVLAFTPPLTIAKRELDRAVIVLKTLLKLS